MPRRCSAPSSPDGGLSAQAVISEADIAGLNAALDNIGYMLTGLIGLALLLSLRPGSGRKALPAREAEASIH